MKIEAIPDAENVSPNVGGQEGDSAVQCAAGEDGGAPAAATATAAAATGDVTTDAQDETRAKMDVNSLLAARISELEKSEDAETAKRIARAVKKHTKEIRSALEEIKTPQEQVQFFEKRYMQTYRNMMRIENESYVVSRNLTTAQRERDLTQAELLKTNQLKAKLELLCKELQKHNKIVSAESKRVAAEEAAKRAELSEKFQVSIKDICEKMDVQGDEREKVYRENDMLREKLTSIVEQMELREKQFENHLHAKDLEKQLEEAKAKHAAEVAKQESAKALAYKSQVEHMARTEAGLKEQIAMYTEKFDSFKDTITKSNEVYGQYKKEMERLSKRIIELEKEKAKLLKSAAKKEVMLSHLINDKKTITKEFETARGQRDKLEKLCRSMQLDRNALKEAVRQLTARLEGGGGGVGGGAGADDASGAGVGAADSGAGAEGAAGAAGSDDFDAALSSATADHAASSEAVAAAAAVGNPVEE